MKKLCLKIFIVILTLVIGVTTADISKSLFARNMQNVSSQTQTKSQTNKHSPTFVSEQIKSTQENFNFKSPYEIANYINEHKIDADINGIWDYLNVKQEDGRPGKCGQGNYQLCSCTAKVIEVEKSSKSHLAMLRIAYLGEHASEYLLFTKKGHWHFLALVSSDSHYLPDEPFYKLHNSQNDTWLILRENWGGGTGYLCNGETWYQISEGGIKEVLSYAIEGHLLSVPNIEDNFEFKTNVLTTKVGKKFIIKIGYTVLTNPSTEKVWEWQSSNQYVADFIWDSKNKSFSMAENSSTIQQLKGHAIYEFLFDRIKALNY